MTFAKLVRSLLLNFILSPFTGTAFAAPRLQIQEVDLVGYKGSALRVQVDLSCGSELYGLVVRATKGNRLEIAAAVMADSVVCTSLPDPKEIVADFISTAGYTAVAAMAVDGNNPRLTVARTSDVKLLPASAKGSAQEIEAIYLSRCGTPVGTLIRRANNNRLEIGVAETVNTHGFSAECRPKQARKRVAALNPQGRYDVSPLPEKPANLTRAFFLRYAAIKPGSLKRGTATGVELTYARACNDAPVGLVIDDKGVGADGKRRVEVGMIVARYYNFPCPAGKKTVWDSFGDDDVRLTGKNLMIGFRAATDGETLSVKTPTMLSMVSGAKPGLTVSYMKPCASAAGVVYTRDMDDKLTIGVLMTTKSGLSCKAKQSEVSLYQSFLAERVRTTGVMPLRLKGQFAR
jgi:hypothetical protein